MGLGPCLTPANQRSAQPPKRSVPHPLDANRKVERGQRSVRLENILRIADGLEITPGTLLDGLPIPTDS